MVNNRWPDSNFQQLLDLIIDDVTGDPIRFLVVIINGLTQIFGDYKFLIETSPFSSSPWLKFLSKILIKMVFSSRWKLNWLLWTKMIRIFDMLFSLISWISESYFFHIFLFIFIHLWDYFCKMLNITENILKFLYFSFPCKLKKDFSVCKQRY